MIYSWRKLCLGSARCYEGGVIHLNRFVIYMIKAFKLNPGLKEFAKKSYPKYDNPGHFLRTDELRNNNLFYIYRLIDVTNEHTIENEKQ